MSVCNKTNEIINLDLYVQTRDPPLVYHWPWTWVKSRPGLLPGRFPKREEGVDAVLALWEAEVASRGVGGQVGRAIDHWHCAPR